MAVNLSALAGAGQQFFTDSGVILSGGKLYSYAAGTTTPQTTYTSASGSTAHTNPIILNSAGRVATGEIWLTAGSNYKFALYTSTDVLITTWDNITGINGTGIATNAVNVTYDPAGMGAVATTVQAKLRESVSVKDFGATGNGSTNDTAAIQAALNASTIVYFPQGTYLTGALTLSQNQKIYGFGATLSYSGTTGTLLQCYNSSDSLQTSNYSEVNGFILLGSQTLTSGSVGLDAGLSARLILRDVRCENFDVGFKIVNAQFGSAYSIKAYACNVGLYIKPSISGGGSNSWSFYDYQGIANLKAAVLTNNTTVYPNHSIYFRNPSLLGNVGVSFASFNCVNITMDGGAPESNNASLSSYTFDGLTIPACSMYVNNTQLNITNFYCAEALVTPFLKAENNSFVYLYGFSGYGATQGNIFTADSTSGVVSNNNISTVSQYENFIGTPLVPIASSSGNGFQCMDNAFQSISVTNEATNPLTTSLSDFNGASSSSVWNSTRGLVGQLVFNASAGNQDTNRVRFFGLTNNAGMAVMGLSVMSSVNTSIKFGLYGAPVQATQRLFNLLAGVWYRLYHVIEDASIPAGSYYVLYPSTAEGATIQVSQAQILSYPTKTAAAAQGITNVLSGAYNPKIGAVHFGRKDSAIPTTGTWVVGDVVYNSAPASAGFIGWVCTVAGTPGTWRTFGLIS